LISVLRRTGLSAIFLRLAAFCAAFFLLAGFFAAFFLATFFLAAFFLVAVFFFATFFLVAGFFFATFFLLAAFFFDGFLQQIFSPLPFSWLLSSCWRLFSPPVFFEQPISSSTISSPLPFSLPLCVSFLMTSYGWMACFWQPSSGRT
jgi:hypothetical protein